ncbi:PAS domain S-box protein [Paenibacillus sp. LMG 31458]|uniref:histidine kinase n=1 Tax=Paenibacillus phytorum TaxID=2654977 RepID=A0ABX1XTM2_9BACL|nr:PAS domain S-box protein [Paenibacillus phytorum]NOU71877.1 PAS domain S-box protein [Paenibacillus phytorum]
MPKVDFDRDSVYQQVYTFAPNAIALVSMDGTIRSVNPSFYPTLGYTEQEAIGLTLKEITHPDDLNKVNALIQEVLNGNSLFYELEKRCIQKNGNLIWASVRLSLVRDEKQGTPLYFIVHIIDISDKIATEQKLLKIEELYELISENAQDIITLVNPDGNIEYLSPSVRDLLGYETEELIGKDSSELNHPEDLEKIRSEPFSDNEVVTYRSRHKNGTYIWFETAIKLIRDDQGRLQKVLGIGRDITERKKYQDNLAEAQHIAMLGSWELDILDDKITFSEEFYQINNLFKKNLPSNPTDLAFMIHPEDQQRFHEFIDQTMQGTTISSEFRNLQLDGTIKYMQIRVSVTFDENGIPVKMNGTTQDITERKKVELKLQESVERYTSLKKYNHDAIISLDVKGRIINTNEMAERLTGYKVIEMRGERISKFIGERNLRRILSYSIEDVTTERKINKIRHKDGHHVEVLTTIAPIIINKENVGYYVIAKDMTEQKQLLIAKEAAENTNKAKSEFLAMMSHEIRTPMNGVIGMTDLLLTTTDLDDEQKEYVEIINKSGNTLIKIINDILDFSKIEAGKTELQEQPFDIRDCIDDTLAVLMPKAHEKKLDIQVSMITELPYKLIGDYDRVKQVLMNLISNAIKFTYSGGVFIEVENNGRENQKLQLKISIKDTGIGIPKEKLNHLFDPFYQLDSFMTRQSEGTGLGLAISKKIVGLMGGDIWIEQTGEPGATFVFTVWFKEEVSYQEDSSLQEIFFVQKPLKVLIAEDNQINQLVLRKMIEKMGHFTSIVENGNQVIRALAYETYDIIFMDIQMPVLNGLETTKQIKETMPPEKVPYIIAVTANALKGDREKCLEAGMDDYISKPIKSEVIFDRIEKFQKTQRREINGGVYK